MPRLRRNDPEKVGPYTITSRLGSGGMGIVYQAERGVQRVAIKMLNSSLLDDAGARHRLIREAQTLKALSSPFIARLLDWSVTEDEAWIALDFINGFNLRQLVKSIGPIQGERWWALAAGLVEALSVFHRQGIVHRDIKPSNIVVSNLGPVVVDFGISQVIDATRLTRTGSVEGSPAWLSPEQLASVDIGTESDIFSLASTLVFAAKGQSPWGAEEDMSVPVLYGKILDNTPDLSGLSARQVDFLQPLFERNPMNRPSASELVSQLGPCPTDIFADPTWLSEWETIPDSGDSDTDSTENSAGDFDQDLVSGEFSADIGTGGTREKTRPVYPEDGERTETLEKSVGDDESFTKKHQTGLAGLEGHRDFAGTGRPRRFLGAMVAGAVLVVAAPAFYFGVDSEVFVGSPASRMVLEWVSGDLWGESPVSAPDILGDYYVIGQSSLTRASCISDTDRDLWGGESTPLFEILGEDGSWSPVGDTVISASSNVPQGSQVSASCDPGFELTMVSTVSRDVIESRQASADCVPLRYREPETELWEEREEQWCVWVDAEPPLGALTLPTD